MTNMAVPDTRYAVEIPSNTFRVGNVEVTRSGEGLVKSIRLGGRVLALENDPAAIRRQLEGIPLSELPPDEALVSGVSTDAIIAARPDCYYPDDARLGGLPLRTLKVKGENPIAPESIRAGHFAALAAGTDWGCGSSREHAVICLRAAGIGVVYAPSIAPIHLQNLVNTGMFPITDRAVMERLMRGEEVSVNDLLPGLGDIQQRMVRRGGFFPFMKALSEGHETIPPIETPQRPMTIAEKIMAAHMNTRDGAVKPGDSGTLKVDVTLAHDYTTAQVDDLIMRGLGRPSQINHPDRHHTFKDHLLLIARGQAGATREEIEAVLALHEGQEAVARRTGIHFHATEEGGSTGICHQVFREKVVKPGQVVIGTDSHTCSGGTLNAYAIGVGSTHIASAWENDVVLESVPETIKINFTGKLPKGCTGKDVMLVLAHIAKTRAQTKGKAGVLLKDKVLEFSGSGLEFLSADDQWVLANMATECSAKTGIVAPNKVMRNYLMKERGLSVEEVDASFVYPDEGATYADEIAINLSQLEPYIATPGHTGNGVPLSTVAGTVVDKAYCGSCTAGSIEVMRQFATVLRGRQTAITAHIQAGSRVVLEQARREGLIEVLERAGVKVIEEPGCGACLAAGPGGPSEGEIVISATNRNFDERMGPGKAYLANPGVVAVAAVLGRIPTLQEYLEMGGFSH